MTKEELEKEVEEYSNNWKINKKYKWNFAELVELRAVIFKAYKDGAEPREKQIEIDAIQIRALQKQNGELTDKVKDLEDKLANADYQLEGRDNEIRELKEKIEKMKCCENCKYYNNHYNEVVCKRQVINCKRILRQATRDQWEIKEK